MTLSTQSFEAIAGLFQRVSGIRLPPTKRQLVVGRLQKLAGERGSPNLDAYVADIVRGGDEREITRVVDRLTTNETYFFREPEHFQHLGDVLAARAPGGGDFRVWSAASSSGEEAYSIAMLLADKIGPRGWEVVGTDLSTAMVDAARRGLYPMQRARHTPPPYLKRFCLKGTGPHEGELLVARELRERVHFRSANLMQPLPELGRFDVVFLRNVLIYFDAEAKRSIVQRVLPTLKPGGFLYSGHAESLGNLRLPLQMVRPAVYARS